MRALRRGVAAVATGSLLLGASVDAAAGTTPVESAARWHLDPSFGTGGFAVIDPEPGGDPWRWGGDIAVQPDGKIVVASRARETEMGLFRLLPDGTLDPTFGDDGFAVWPVVEDRGSSITITLQTVGTQTKILAIGAGEIPPLKIWRFNADGSPDDAHDADPDVVFGKRGLLVLRPYRGGIGWLPQLSVGPDDSIAVTAQDRRGGYRGALLIRRHRDGARDTDFAPRGIRKIGRPAFDSVITSSPGHLRIVTAGVVEHGDKWKLRAYTADGERDETFGTGGKVTVRPPNSPPICYGDTENPSFRELPDGDLVVAGLTCAEQSYEVESAVRLTADGELDLGFGEDGWAFPLDPEVRQPLLWDRTIHADGSVAWGNNQGRTMFVGGVRPDGRPDPRFGHHGFVKFRLPEHDLFDSAAIDGLEYDDQGRILGSVTVHWTDDRISAILFRLTTD